MQMPQAQLLQWPPHSPTDTMKEQSPQSENIFAACVIMAIFVLAVIHFTQTGGLPAFFARL